MQYLNRNISIKSPRNDDIHVSEQEFLSGGGPMVLLGEPGAGKTAICEAMSKYLDGRFTTANLLRSGGLNPSTDDQQILFVDGVDELLTHDADGTFTTILKNLKNSGYKNWVLTCRAYDWRSVLFNQRIKTTFGVAEFKVGRLEGLSNEEIPLFAKNFGLANADEEFLEEAKTRGALDLIRNPQMLRMLCLSIKQSGWPTSRTDLYRTVCRILIEELNPVHQSIRPERPNIEDSLDTAGWICTLLLFSGLRGINHDGHNELGFVRPADLVSNRYPIQTLNYVVSTMLFRSYDDTTVEPCHRTVAEFLAAGWLTKQLRAKGMSRKRLLNFLHGPRQVVLTAFRGIYAWIATLDRSLTDEFVPIDPYGCMRYGDVSQYSVEQVRNLLSSLKQLADVDPYFRAEDWGTYFSHGLVRSELGEDIVKLIESKEPRLVQFKCVLLEALCQASCGTDTLAVIKKILVDKSRTYIERDWACKICLATKPESVRELNQALRKIGDYQSLRLAINLQQERTSDFSGTEIAKTLCELEKAAARDGETLIFGIGYRLKKLVTYNQLTEILDHLSLVILEDTNNQGDRIKEIERRFWEFLSEALRSERQLGAQNFYRWLHNIAEHHSYKPLEWNEIALPFFRKDDHLRREIQAIFLSKAANLDTMWLNLFRLSDISYGLHLLEDDVCFHMKQLVKSTEKAEDWIERWRNLVRWAQIHSDFDGSAIELAQEQVGANPALKIVLQELMDPPQTNNMPELTNHLTAEEKQAEQEAKDRHLHFNKIHEQLSAGQNLQALGEVATAYLNGFSNLSYHETPIARVRELVGKDNINAAINGIVVAANRPDIPSAKDCATLCANENKKFYLEEICLVRCLLAEDRGEPLESLPEDVLSCALAACNWGVHLPNSPAETIQSRLEAIIFADMERKRSFVVDTIEPYLESGQQNFAGIHHITTDERFGNIIGELALDWLKRFPNASVDSIRSLLQAAVEHSNRAQLRQFVERVLKANEWLTPEYQSVWIVAAYLTDFENFETDVRAFAEKDRTHIWTFRNLLWLGGAQSWNNFSPTMRQLGFIIESFASSWPPITPSSKVYTGEQHPHNATDFIRTCINGLVKLATEEALEELNRLLASDAFGDYLDYAKHMIAQAKRNVAENSWRQPTLNDVKNMICAREPSSFGDLQMMILDKLEQYQKTVSGGQTNPYQVYWNGESPHVENYCRDRLLEALEPTLGQYGIRAHKEGAMSNEKRCDVLCTYGEKDLPIEVKGQWHNKIWSAASDQLEKNYSSAYRSEGHGIYLVIWFGEGCGKKDPRRSPSGKIPSSAKELFEELFSVYSQQISPLTKFFVLDVSKPRHS